MWQRWLAFSIAISAVLSGLIAIQLTEKRVHDATIVASHSLTHEYKIQSAEEQISNYNLWLDIFTAILTISTIGLWSSSERAARRQSRELKIVERAFIAVEPGGIRPFGNDARIACDVIISNAGNLPARNVRWCINRKFSTNDSETDFPEREIRLVGDIVIAPKAHARKGSRATNQEEVAENMRGKGPYEAWLYVWGRISYHDGFNPGRYIDFCHRYNLHGAVRFMIPAENARYHAFGNRTDDE